MKGMRRGLKIAWKALVLTGLLIGSAGCGSGWSPGVTPGPMTEVAQPQATPSSTGEPVAAPFQSPIQTPTPTPTLWIEPPPPTRPPTPTIPPVPTRLPTPIVTRIPTAAPPIIPLPSRELEPYTLVYREGSVIRAVDSDGRHDRIVIDIPAHLSRFLIDPSFLMGAWVSPAPDGSRLALVVSNFENLDAVPGGRLPEFAIYLLDSTTRELRLLVEDGVKPVWSPNGDRIAYRSTRTQGLWVVDVATGDAQELFSVGYPETENQADWFTWSPDAHKIAVVKNWGGVANVGGIWLVDMATGAEAVPLVEMEMNASSLEWSPTGRELLFLTSVGEHITSERPENLWLIDVESHDRRQLTSNMGVYGGRPIWSSDGNWVFFSGVNLLEGETPAYDLWLVTRYGNDLRRLTSDLAVDLDPLLLPDGIRILFLKRGSGLWEMDLVNGAFRQVYPRDISYTVKKGYWSSPRR